MGEGGHGVCFTYVVLHLHFESRLASVELALSVVSSTRILNAYFVNLNHQ